MAAVYKCLGCGSMNGEACGDKSQNWYWRVMTHGKVGPFHDAACASSFEMNTDGGDKFSLREYQHLEYLRDLYEKAR